MAKKQSKGNQLAVPARPLTTPEGQRSVDLPSYLARVLPAYGHPGWLEATRWRSVVRNQPLAIACRDTLLDNIKNLEWDIVASDPEEKANKEVKKAIDYYTNLFEHLEGDFDRYIDLMGQDFLDLPFGAACEIGREADDPQGPILWIEHIDAATLFPSYDDEYPVIQSVPEMVGRAVAFPKHAIDRIIYTPRPEIRRKGWGMAPPEKVYLSLEMLFRGDTYYWKLLLDTPEAGILDLMDMDAEDAATWVAGFKTLFQGIDGFKVPVLHSHTTPAQWIPFSRPPTDMLYDKSIIHYGQILAAGYGMRLSDIGLSQLEGGGTLAGIIREERQTRRSGYANVREKFKNHFNRLLPHDEKTGGQILKFVWIERDDEAMVARGRAMLAVGQGLQTFITAGLIDTAEGRHEIVAQGLMETDIDPDKLPEPPEPAVNPLAALMGGGQQPPPGQKGKPTEGQDEKAKVAVEGGATPPSEGGRGSQPKPVGKSLVDRVRGFVTREKLPALTPNPATADAKALLRQMEEIIAPGLALIPQRASEYGNARLLKLIRVATMAAVPKVRPIVRALTDDQAESYWVPQFNSLVFDQDNDFMDALEIRQTSHEIQAAIERALEQEDWWHTASDYDKDAILRMMSEAYKTGAVVKALEIARAAYIAGLTTSPELGVGYSFTLSNAKSLANLTARAGDLVRWIDDGTKTFIKRIITSGVNQGLSSPKIARALRDGFDAEKILAMEGYTRDVIDIILRGLTDMSEYRTNSIVNYEVAWAENAGRLEQMDKSGLTQKAWVHLGERGVTDKGNVHPCPICEANEALGFVEMGYLYDTVFEPQLFPPAHPGVCHCDIVGNPDDLAKAVSEGTFAPWVGN